MYRYSKWVPLNLSPNRVIWQTPGGRCNGGTNCEAMARVTVGRSLLNIVETALWRTAAGVLRGDNLQNPGKGHAWPKNFP